jgi:hypothetical protein
MDIVERVLTELKTTPGLRIGIVTINRREAFALAQQFILRTGLISAPWEPKDEALAFYVEERAARRLEPAVDILSPLSAVLGRRFDLVVCPRAVTEESKGAEWIKSSVRPRIVPEGGRFEIVD